MNLLGLMGVGRGTVDWAVPTPQILLIKNLPQKIKIATFTRTYICKAKV